MEWGDGHHCPEGGLMVREHGHGRQRRFGGHHFKSIANRDPCRINSERRARGGQWGRGRSSSATRIFRDFVPQVHHSTFCLDRPALVADHFLATRVGIASQWRWKAANPSSPNSGPDRRRGGRFHGLGVRRLDLFHMVDDVPDSVDEDRGIMIDESNTCGGGLAGGPRFTALSGIGAMAAERVAERGAPLELVSVGGPRRNFGVRRAGVTRASGDFLGSRAGIDARVCREAHDKDEISPWHP